MAILRGGRLESSFCEEIHLFKPLDSSTSGAMTIINQHVKLLHESKAKNIPILKTGKISSLLFSRLYNKEDSSVKNEELVLNLLKQYKDSPGSSRPEIFTNLVQALRKLSNPEIKLLYQRLKNDESLQIVIDAVPLLKTDAGIGLMKDLVESQSIPENVLDIWFSTLPFYRNPSNFMIDTVAVS